MNEPSISMRSSLTRSAIQPETFELNGCYGVRVLQSFLRMLEMNAEFTLPSTGGVCLTINHKFEDMTFRP